MPSDPLLARAERKLYLRATDPTDDGDHPWASLCADLVAALRSETARAERAETERNAARQRIDALRTGLLHALARTDGDLADYVDAVLDLDDFDHDAAEVAEIHAATRQPQDGA